jgi:lysozyme
MTIDNGTISLIKKWEKLSLEPYADHKQWSIGYGTYAGPYPGPKPNTRLSNEAEAHQLLLNDVSKRVGSIKNRLTRAINQNQFSALVSFAFNTGLAPAYLVIDDINKGYMNAAAERMLKYVYASGQKLNGLVSRRNDEVRLFNTPVQSKAGGTPVISQDKRALLSVTMIVVATVIIFKLFL